MNRICFGMPTLLEMPDIDSTAKLCKELCLDFIELNQNLPPYQPGALNLFHIREVLEQNGLFATIHLDEALNPFDFNDFAARAYCETVLSSIRAAKKLFCPTLTMHLHKGVYFTLPGRKAYLYEEYGALYRSRLASFRALCEEAAGDTKIKICLENTDWSPAFIRESVEYLLDSPVFCLTYDVGHDHATGFADRDFIFSHAPKIAHIHLHDASETQNHLPLGIGDLDLKTILGAAQALHCRCVVEVKTVEGLRQSVELLQKPGLFGAIRTESHL